jgi:hypothetical protein
MAVAITPVPAALPVQRLRRNTVAAVTPIACTFLAMVGAGLSFVPQSVWLDLPRPLVVWSTFFALAGVMFGARYAARAAGHSPWIAPISLLAIYFFFRYGWGTLVVNYCEIYPWQRHPHFRWTFHRFGVWAYLPAGCQLILVFAAGMMIGSLLALTRNRSMLPRFSWPFSEEKFKKRAMIYAPVSALLNVVQFGLPDSIRFPVQLLGSFIYPLIMLAAYYLFHARNARERAQWSTFLLASSAMALPAGLITGQVNGMMMPVVCIFLGYTIARGAPPWKLIALALPFVAILLLPFSSLYKSAGFWTDKIDQRLDYAVKRFKELGLRGRFELTLERTAIRFAGANQPSAYSRFYPNVYDFEYGKSFKVESSTFVPRVLWADKPYVAPELNKYPAKIGMIQFEGNTTAIFDAISEYYVNFGVFGMFLLSILHGYFWQALYNWLRFRVHALIGVVLTLLLIVQNEDFYGIGLLLTSMIKSVPVWLIMFYLLSRAAKSRKVVL